MFLFASNAFSPVVARVRQNGETSLINSVIRSCPGASLSVGGGRRRTPKCMHHDAECIHHKCRSLCVGAVLCAFCPCTLIGSPFLLHPRYSPPLLRLEDEGHMELPSSRLAMYRDTSLIRNALKEYASFKAPAPFSTSAPPPPSVDNLASLSGL